MKIVINTCFGGFCLSEAAYEKLIEWGVPVREYTPEQRDPETGLYMCSPENEGKIIFRSSLGIDKLIHGKYWDAWTDEHENRSDPLLVKVVEELGEKASAHFARLKVVEIPDGVDYYIEDYDGLERIHEVHRIWE